MSNTTNKQIAQKFIQAWSHDGLGVIDELADPNIVVSYSHFPEPIKGGKNFRAMLKETFSYFPDMRIIVEQIIAENNNVVVRWHYTATHESGEMFGVKASGQSVEVNGMTRYRIANGKVTEEVGVVDNLGLMFQLGALPSQG